MYYLNRFLGALLGLITGSVYALFFLCLAALNVVIALGSCAVNIIAYAISLPRIFAVTLAGLVAASSNFFEAAACATWLIIKAAVAGPILLASNIIENIGRVVWDSVATLVVGGIIAIVQPFVGFGKGLSDGMGAAIVYPFNTDSHPSLDHVWLDQPQRLTRLFYLDQDGHYHGGDKGFSFHQASFNESSRSASGNGFFAGDQPPSYSRAVEDSPFPYHP